MPTPVCDQIDWMFLCKYTLPMVYVNVWNCQARIIFNKEDITDLFINGAEMAEDAVYAFGGTINISGIYPPTEEILSALEKALKDGTLTGRLGW